MKKAILIPVLVCCFLFSCSNKKTTVSNQGDTTQVTTNDPPPQKPEKIYKGVNMDKSKYPDDLFVVLPDMVRSSGYLKGSNEDYRDDFMIDHDPFTWWTPEPNRNGKGAWIELVFDNEVRIEGFEVWGGSHNPKYPKYGDIYKLNNRVKKGICEFSDGSTIQFELTDVDNWQVVRFDTVITTKSIKLRINEVYKGDKWDDLCIAEFLALTPDEEIAYEGGEMAKPVIYLYPPSKTDINVQLDLASMNGTLDVTYPSYGKTGWNVTAYPDGKLIDRETNKPYNYLFWEGTSLKQWNLKDGFVVKGEDAASFLEEKLSYMGLLPNEYNDFIVYWLPQMMKNKYNLVHFANDEYNRDVPIKINPQPESILRIYMVFYGIDKPVQIPEQQLKQFNRKGFTVIEWGGTNISNQKKPEI